MISDDLKLLGLDPNQAFTLDDLKKYFYRAASVCHPDHGGHAEDFLSVTHAYQRLVKFITAKRYCASCVGLGKKLVGSGFDFIAVVCKDCDGSGFHNDRKK